jgi:hypothetical protein
MMLTDKVLLDERTLTRLCCLMEDIQKYNIYNVFDIRRF